MEGSKVEPQYKPVNHWQYSMTSLATPFPSSLTSPSLFFPSSLPAPHSIAFLGFLPFSSPLYSSPLSLPPSIPLPSIPTPSPSLPHPSCQQLFHNGLSNKHLSSTHLPEVIWEPICLQHCYSLSTKLTTPNKCHWTASHLVWYVSNHCLGIV